MLSLETGGGTLEGGDGIFIEEWSEPNTRNATSVRKLTHIHLHDLSVCPAVSV